MMGIGSAPRLIVFLKTFSKIASTSVILIGFFVLLGWMFDIPILKNIRPGWVTMKANTALAFVLSGLSLMLLMEKVNRWGRRLGKVCAFFVFTFGFLTLTQYLIGWNIGLDQLVFQESFDAIGTSDPGRMAPNTAFSFMMIGLALFMLNVEIRPFRFPAGFFAQIAGLIGLSGMLGYFYGVQNLYGIASFTEMALHTAVAFVLLSTSILFTRPDCGLTAIITRESSGGVIARRLLPAAVALPAVLGWVILWGERAGFYGSGFGSAIFSVLIIVIFVALVWRAAKSLDGSETGRMKAEQERDHFFNMSMDMLCIAGFDGYFKHLNPAWEKTIGWKEEELLSKPYLEFIHPEDRESTISEAEKLSGGEATITFENRYRCKDGSYRWLHWKAIPLVEKGLVYATARDVTERKRAEEEIRRSELFLNSIVENLPHMVFVKEAKDLTFVRFNKAGEDLLGFPREDLIGKSDYDFFPKEQADFFISKDRSVLREGRLLEIPEEQVQTKHQGMRFLHTKKIPILDAAEDPQYLLGISVDITDRKQADDAIQWLNEELRQHTSRLEAANKELEAFSYSVSHDLRAPLRGIDGFSQALLEDYAANLDDQGKDYLRRVRAASQRMAQLIDDMLNLSRLTRTEMRREKVDLSHLAKTILAELKSGEPERQVECRITEGLLVNGDTRLLRLALENLLNNAWKFTAKHKKSTIEFGITSEDGEPVYFVRDDGAGFDMAYAGKLFGVFQRLHAATEFPGTGVGLAIVQRIIHRHGGRIWAEGAVDRGAMFFFNIS